MNLWNAIQESYIVTGQVPRREDATQSRSTQSTSTTHNASAPPSSTPESLDINDTLLKQLECPVCFETCLPPIYMCINSHNICNSCRSRTQECSICRQPGVPSTRNRFAEDITSKVKLPCPNTIDGCCLKFKAKEIEAHLEICEMSYKYSCILDELTNDTSINDYCVVWHGSRVMLAQHVRAKHPQCYSESACTVIQQRFGYSKTKQTDVRMITAFGHLFWVIMYSNLKSGVELVPYYIGAKGNENEFECQLEISSADGGFRIVCFAPIYNWSTSADDRKILRIRDEMLLSFLENGLLTVKVTIVKK